MTDRGWVPLVWPVPSSKVITQPFGANPAIYAEMGWRIGHSGLDIRTRTAAFPSGVGTPIIAARGGTVHHAGPHLNRDGSPSGYGIAVILDHADGSRTLYAHLSRTRVAPGATVLAGGQIGDAGSTGNTTGPHLHFEYWQPPFTVPGVWGRADPTPWIEEILFGGEVRALGDEPDEIRVERGLGDARCLCTPFIPELE